MARATFTFQPASAAPTQRQRSGVIGAAGNVGGGQSRSGVVRSDNPALNPSIGANLPGFIDELVRPVMEEAQRSRMMAGFALSLIHI